MTYAEALARAMFKRALEGDRLAMRDVAKMQYEFAQRNMLNVPKKIQIVFDDEPDLYQIQLEKNEELCQEIEALKAQLEDRPKLLSPPSDSDDASEK
jgi:hypothetical protein